MSGQRIVTNMPRTTPTNGGAKRAAIRRAREAASNNGYSQADLDMDSIMAAELAKGVLDDDAFVDDASFDEVDEIGNDFFDGNYDEAKETLAALKQLKTEASDRRGSAKSNFRPESMPRPTPALEEAFDEAEEVEVVDNQPDEEGFKLFAGVSVPIYIYDNMDNILKTGTVDSGDGLVDLVYRKWYENVAAIVDEAFKSSKDVESFKPIQDYTLKLVNILG